MPRRLLNAIALVAALGLARVAAADEPWSRGVSAASKATAQKLLEEGNQLFLANKYKEALDRYSEAVAAWDHPAIRFNIARAQIALDKPLEAYDNVERALAYGAAALDESVYQEALNYQKLLAHQVAIVEVACDQRGVTVKLDGAELVACPGRQRARRLPGKHVLVGEAPGMLTRTRDLTLVGGAVESVELHLDPLSGRGPRWARWKPWAVVGTGLALGGVGVAFNVIAHDRADRLRRDTTVHCPTGCTADEFRTLGLADDERAVDRANAISVTGLALGGIGVVAGVVLVLVNRRVGEQAELHVEGTGASVSVGGRF